MPVELTEAVVIVQSCSVKNVHFSQKKTPMPGSHFIYNLQRVILLKEDLRHMCFPMNFAKFLRTSFLKTTLGDCFWTKEYPCVTRSRHRRCSMKVVLKNCFKYTGRHLCKGVINFLIKLQVSAYNFIIKETLAQMFLRALFLQNTSGVIASA